jgi:hypothetical protein
MGNCYSGSTKLVAKVRFADSFTHTRQHPAVEIQSATFTEMWESLKVMEWNVKEGRYAEFEEALHAYMQLNVCMESHIVVTYLGNAWQFDTVYNDSMGTYRIISI